VNCFCLSRLRGGSACHAQTARRARRHCGAETRTASPCATLADFTQSYTG